MLKEIDASACSANVFEQIGKQWMLISAGTHEKANAMTASWGGMGVLWNKNVVYIFVRPQRFTKTLIDEQDYFALTFFDESYRSMLAYMGKASGKDEDKIAESKLHLLYDKAPYFEEASQTIICRKLYAQSLEPSCFLDETIEKANYPLKDYHMMYVGEIEKVLIKEK